MSYSEEILEEVLEEIEDVMGEFIEKGAVLLKMIKEPNGMLQSLSEGERNSIAFRLMTVKYIIENIDANLDSFNNRLK